MHVHCWRLITGVSQAIDSRCFTGFMGTLQRNYLEETLGAKIVVNGSPAELRHAAESQGAFADSIFAHVIPSSGLEVSLTHVLALLFHSLSRGAHCS